MFFQQKNPSLLGLRISNLLSDRDRQAVRQLLDGNKNEPGNLEEQIEQTSLDARRHARETWESVLTIVTIACDYTIIVAGFILAAVLCRSDFVPPAVKGLEPPTLWESYKLILLASGIILWRLRGRGLYTYRNLLRPSKTWHTLLGALGICLLTFCGLSLVVKTNPPITWKLVVCAAVTVCPVICLWRLLVSRILRLKLFASRLQQRLVVIGGGSQTQQIMETLGDNSGMVFVGWVQAIKPNLVKSLEDYRLGGLHELRKILRRHVVDVAVLVESESLQREGVLAVTKVCEMEHVQFNMVPHFFEVLVSAVRPENIGDMQLLGIHCLPLYGLRNRFLKRTVDLIGALVGLAIAIPLMAIFGTLVFLESPGPVFYRQIRQGRNGCLFYIIKLRSMRLNAESGGKAQWASADDNRRLKVGAFMRKWNIDEIPQFWNVLCGEMSLVGPRPERPELIARFESKVPHYQARHMYRPGMTGWAQINGWRGNTCLEQRIRHDIWYLENWNFWLDFRIMLQTFVRQKNAY